MWLLLLTLLLIIYISIKSLSYFLMCEGLVYICTSSLWKHLFLDQILPRKRHSKSKPQHCQGKITAEQRLCNSTWGSDLRLQIMFMSFPINSYCNSADTFLCSEYKLYHFLNNFFEHDHSNGQWLIIAITSAVYSCADKNS